MEKQFLVDPKTGLINLHYDGLNPADVMALIEKLEANLRFTAKIIKDPIRIMEQSARRDLLNGTLTFQLSWDAEAIEIDLNDDLEIPEPNVGLTSDEYEKYCNLIRAMME